MKALYHISLFILVGVLLCGCPYSSVYQLDDSPSVYVDEGLIGKWATFVTAPNGSRPEPVKMILNRKSDFEYDIIFIGFVNELKPFRVLSSDSVKGTAFLSDISGRRFLNINVKSQVYIAELKYKDDKLSVLPLSEHFTSKMIRNNSSLRNSVDIHYKLNVHPNVEKEFCLMNMTRVN